MANTMFFSLLLNIGLLVLIATLLTKFPVVRRMFLDGPHSPGSRVALALIFGSVSIISTYTGIKANGAIVNTRVIGVLAAGLLGGPQVGIGAALIGGCHRYLFDIGGFTAVSCAVSTFVEGLIGASFSKRFRQGKLDNTGIFLITVLAEVGQMAIILLISKPFEAALALVKIIAFPMIIMNALGMVIFIATFNMVFLEEDSEIAGKMRLALNIADKCLPHLRQGLYSVKDMQETVNIIYKSFPCSLVMITDHQGMIAVCPEEQQSRIHADEALSAVCASIQNRQVTTFMPGEENPPLSPVLKNHAVIVAPLIEMDKPVGSLTMVVKKQWHSSTQATVSFAGELARLFSTQLELSDLDYQKRLRRKAELKALQSQVNPHFLYNALNTIAYVCRENPDRARELILTLSSYYRQTLENDRYMLNLHTELYHVSSYLELEKARFEEKLQVNIQVSEDINCMVPSFILQPLVENAVRYGAEPSGLRYVGINAAQTADGIEISVSDHGSGFPQEIIDQLYSGKPMKGIGLENVHKRLKSIYGEKHGLVIDSSPKGSRVSFLIPAEPARTDTEMVRNGDLHADSRQISDTDTKEEST